MCAPRPPINLVLTILLFGLRGGGLSLIHTWGAKMTDFENEVFYPLLSEWESKCIFFFCKRAFVVPGKYRNLTSPSV